MIYTIIYQCFRICSNSVSFNLEMHKVKDIFNKNGYPLSFFDRCLKKFLSSRDKELVSTVEKKKLVLFLPFLGIISLQTRTKLRKSLSKLLGCCEISFIFKTDRRLSSIFRFKDSIPKEL